MRTSTWPGPLLLRTKKKDHHSVKTATLKNKMENIDTSLPADLLPFVNQARDKGVSFWLMHQSIPSANPPPPPPGNSRGFTPTFSQGSGICTIRIVRGSDLLSIIKVPSCQLIARLRNHNATEDDNVDFRSFLKNLHSKLGKLM